jgi:hypothetical protein
VGDGQLEERGKRKEERGNQQINKSTNQPIIIKNEHSNLIQ